MWSDFLSFVSPTPSAWFTLGCLQSCLCSFHSFPSCHSPLPPAPDSPLFCISSSLACTPQSPVRINSSVRDSFSPLLKYKSQDGPAWLPKKMSDHTPNRAKMCYRSPHHKSHNCSCFGGPFWLDNSYKLHDHSYLGSLFWLDNSYRWPFLSPEKCGHKTWTSGSWTSGSWTSGRG